MISGLILAAGESRRMGEPKPLIRLNGLTFLQHIEKALRLAGIEEIAAVIGHQAELVQTESGAAVQFIINKDYELGQLSSLKVGIQALRNTEAAVVCLVDQPHIRPDWILQLIRVFQDSRPLIVRPCFGKRFGHPVLYSAEIFPEILVLPEALTAKVLAERFTAHTRIVDMDSEAVLFDADTQADLPLVQRLLSAAAGEETVTKNRA